MNRKRAVDIDKKEYVFSVYLNCKEQEKETNVVNI
jgi:hypothetical protein